MLPSIVSLVGVATPPREKVPITHLNVFVPQATLLLLTGDPDPTVQAFVKGVPRMLFAAVVMRHPFQGMGTGHPTRIISSSAFLLRHAFKEPRTGPTSARKAESLMAVDV